MKTGGLYVLFAAGTPHGLRTVRTDAMGAIDALCWVSRMRDAGVDAQVVSATVSVGKNWMVADDWLAAFAILRQRPLKPVLMIYAPCIH